MNPKLDLQGGFFRGLNTHQTALERNNGLIHSRTPRLSRFTFTSLQTSKKPSEEKPSAAALAEKLLKRLESDPRPADQAWDAAIRDEENSSRVIAIVTTWLHRQKKYDQAVEGLLSAIRSGLAEPWMYDVLAVEMRLAKRPQKQIDRVLVSRIDFASGNDAQMLVAASNLAGFDAFDEALSICKELAKRNPHQPELWSTARRIADLSGNLKQRTWTRTETLRHVWEPGFEILHREMTVELQDLIATAEKESDHKTASMIREALSDAIRRDLRIRIEWVGDADIDLSVVEPDGTVCSRKQNATHNGGMLVKQDSPVDANGKKRAEEYVCVDAAKGKYGLIVEHIDGRVLLGRVQVKVIRNEGTAAEKAQTFALTNVVETPGNLAITFE